jgi:hypothetical protein
MPAPGRPIRPPSLSRRAVVTGSVLGLGLVASTTATAPAALATNDGEQSSSVVGDGSTGSTTTLNTTPVPEVVDGPAVTPFFGSGKQVDVTVAPAAGTAPADLDLSGAELDLVATGTTTPVVTSCTTDSTGSCTFYAAQPPGWEAWTFGGPVTPSNSPVASGTYDVLESRPSAGLARVPGVLGTVDIEWFSERSDSATVTAASLFRTTVTATVSTTDSPARAVPGAGYQLAGTAYARRPGAPADTQGTVPLDGTTDATGVVTYQAWFPPGRYTLTPQGSAGAAPTSFTIDPQVKEPPDPTLVSVQVPGVTTPPTSPPTSPSATPASTSAPAPAATSTTASPPRRNGTPAAAVPSTDTAPTPSSTSSTSKPKSALPREDLNPPVATVDTTPKLATVSRAIPYTSIVAIGIPLVAVVLVIVLLLIRRRRARYYQD